MSKTLKSLAVVVALGLSASVTAAECGIQMVSALTANHKKEVRMCLYNNGKENVVRYQFGKVGQKPELDVVKPARNAGYEDHTYGQYPSSGVSFRNGDYTYSVSDGYNDTGETYAYLTVTKGSKQLASIELDFDSFGKVRKGEYQMAEGLGLDDFGVINYIAEEDEPAKPLRMAPKIIN